MGMYVALVSERPSSNHLPVVVSPTETFPRCFKAIWDNSTLRGRPFKARGLYCAPRL